MNNVHDLQPTLDRAAAAVSSPPDESVIAQALLGVEKCMMDLVNSDVEVLRDASRHIIGAGGKRVRPRLALLAFFAAGGTSADLKDVTAIAAAVELIHTASVVHDDINDHGVLRRGRPSVNALWGRTFALLTGDFLFTKVFELIAPYGIYNTILAEATTALVEGETLQASAVKNRQFTRETYYRIIGLKTAALFRAAAMLGAKCSGASERDIQALGEFGFNIGLSFQIVDDVLDVVGSPEQLGKTSGIDIAQGRGFAVAYENENGQIVEHDDTAADPMISIRKDVLAGTALEEARVQARRFVREAIEGISHLPESAARTELMALAESVVERDF
ncbi:MAG: polyprenyl synthetase family protein [Pleurocapsa minor GSE-CHR-MK-17-07R]|jgi:geranylgeranyl pyrophosphate synthase|nr:polyprenyl synthetase family protein [Pleurocapsa minor GSE-CHR-MK 17-07R]